MTPRDTELSIGIFTDDFYPESGGVSRSIQLQLQELVRAGQRPTLLAPRYQLTPPDCAWEGLPHWRLPRTPSFLCSVEATRRLARRLAADHQFDIVHSQNERGSMFLAAMVAQELGVPQVHTFHSNYAGTHLTTPLISGLNSITYLDWSSRWLARLAGTVPTLAGDAVHTDGDPALAGRDWRSLARIAASVDAFTSPAGYLVDAIVEASAGSLAGRGHVVASGVAESFVHASRQRPRDGITRFVSCGRLGAEKRVDVIVDAFDRLSRDDAELQIIGTGAEESALRQRASRVRHGTVRFLGHIDGAAQIAQEIADADVFVLASYRFDTQGMVLAEAAAAGTPILYCDDRLSVGVGPDNALLAGHTAGELAEGMRTLMDSPQRLASMSTASKELGLGLTAQAMGERYLQVYRQALQAG